MPALAAVQELISQARSALGLTWQGFGDRLQELVLLAVEQAFDLANSGPEKKQIVLDRVSQLVDAVADKLPLPWFLSPFRGLIVSRIIKPAVLSAADGLIEAAYRRLKELKG